METKKKVNIPKMGAARRWAQKLKEWREQKPPKEWVDQISGKTRKEKDIAASSSTPPEREMEI